MRSVKLIQGFQIAHKLAESLNILKKIVLRIVKLTLLMKWKLLNHSNSFMLQIPIVINS